MLTQQEVEALLQPNSERANIEFTVSTNNTDKFSEAICAFSNQERQGYLFIGVNDNGTIANIPIDDKLQKDIAAIRRNGQILPQPSISTEVFKFSGGDILVIEVLPSLYPPVRYKGKTFIRVGATKAIANEAEERVLTERRSVHARSFDALPCLETQMDDLATDIIRQNYLPEAIDREILRQNHRNFELQLASLRLFDVKRNCPTNASILLFGLDPLYFLPGAYIEYLRIEGTERSLDRIKNQKEFKGCLFDTLRDIDSFTTNNIIKTRPIRTEGFRDEIQKNYPLEALREYIMNAIMHRDYASNAPIRIREFDDRIEIENPGGLFGGVRLDNFPNASDYRNPIIAEAMKILGYVNRFNFGIADAERHLQRNGNPKAEFEIEHPTSFVVSVKINPSWLHV